MPTKDDDSLHAYIALLSHPTRIAVVALGSAASLGAIVVVDEHVGTLFVTLPQIPSNTLAFLRLSALPSAKHSP